MFIFSAENLQNYSRTIGINAGSLVFCKFFTKNTTNIIFRQKRKKVHYNSGPKLSSHNLPRLPTLWGMIAIFSLEANQEDEFFLKENLSLYCAIMIKKKSRTCYPHLPIWKNDVKAYFRVNSPVASQYYYLKITTRSVCHNGV